MKEELPKNKHKDKNKYKIKDKSKDFLMKSIRNKDKEQINNNKDKD